jgi:hypothetical protein
MLPESLSGTNASDVTLPADALPSTGEITPPTGVTPPPVGATPSDSPLEVTIPEGLNPTVPPIEAGASPLEVAPPEGWRPNQDIDIDLFTIDTITEADCAGNNANQPVCGGSGTPKTVGDYNTRQVYIQAANMSDPDFADLYSTLKTYDRHLANVANEVRYVLKIADEYFGKDSKEFSDLVDIFVMISPLDSATQDEAMRMISFAVTEQTKGKESLEYIRNQGAEAWKSGNQGYAAILVLNAIDDVAVNTYGIAEPSWVEQGINVSIRQIFIPGYDLMMYHTYGYDDFGNAMAQPSALQYGWEVVANLPVGGLLAKGAKPLVARLASAWSRLPSGVKTGVRTAGRVLCSSVNSFSSDTLVHTNKGFIAISAATGSWALAYNEQSGQNEYQPILQVFENNDPEVTYLSLQDSESPQLEMIVTTPGHPFYLEHNIDNTDRPAPQGHEDLAEPWVGAGDLKRQGKTGGWYDGNGKDC